MSSQARSVFRKQIEKLLRRPSFECLEGRRVLNGDVDIFLDPPPEPYLSENLDVYVSRLNWEFDRWLEPRETDPKSFRSEDSRVRIDEQNRAHLSVRSTPDDVEELLSQMRSLGEGVEIIGNYVALGENAFADLWMPVYLIDEMAQIPALAYAWIQGLWVTTNDMSLSSVSQESLAQSLQNPPVDQGSEQLAHVLNRWNKLGNLGFAAEAGELVFGVNSETAEAGSDLYFINNDRILVTIFMEENFAEEDIKGLTGLEIVATQDHVIDAWVSTDALRSLQQLETVLGVMPEYRPVLNTGTVSGQGDSSLKTDAVRNLLGFEGQDVSIGVISDSFNRLGTANADVQSGNLPNVTIVSEGPSGSTDEGRAMLQIVHDIAPAASLLFATGFLGEQSMADSINALVSAGADVIVDDVAYFTNPMFMDGRIAQAVDTAVAQGVVYVSSAGNYGSQSYEADGFRPSSVTRNYGRGNVNLYDFNPDSVDDPYQSITIPQGQKVYITLQWEDPFASLAQNSGGAQRDLDLLIYDSAANSLISGSAVGNFGMDPVEVVSIGPFTNTTTSGTADTALGSRHRHSGHSTWWWG